MYKPSEVSVTLERDGVNTPWGIRLVGGSDLDTPLIITKVQLGSPAEGELFRGDIITKIEDYDSRDLRHDDAHLLFKRAGNRIKIVIHRDTKSHGGQTACNGSSKLSAMSPLSYPCSPIPAINVSPYSQSESAPSPKQLPQTVFPPFDESGRNTPMSQPPSRPRSVNSNCFSPQPTRDQYQFDSSAEEEQASTLVNQPYRTTPLILPGAKVKKDNAPTESYLRHHPNPAMRANHGAHVDYQDILMKQKVADSVLHRVVGDDPNKVIRKQFNTPIGLYSDGNIEKAIHQTVPNAMPADNGYSVLEPPRPSKIEGYKKTVLYDPLKSETYRAIQEDNMGYTDQRVHEVAHPVQTKVFHPTRLAHHPKNPPSSYPPANPHNMNSMGGGVENINQSGSFKRLMYSVLGETDY